MAYQRMSEQRDVLRPNRRWDRQRPINRGTSPLPNPPIVPATGATAGTPGYFTPTGAEAPASLAGMPGITANPLSMWTVGQHVVLGDASHAHWTGAVWAAGDAT